MIAFDGIVISPFNACRTIGAQHGLQEQMFANHAILDVVTASLVNKSFNLFTGFTGYQKAFIGTHNFPCSELDHQVYAASQIFQ